MPKSQAKVNTDWNKDFATSIGTVTILTPPKHASTLPKPYEFEVPASQGTALINDLKALCKSHTSLVQCELVTAKPIKRGVRLSVWLLGYRPGLCGSNASDTASRCPWSSSTGISAKTWKQLTKDIKNRLVTTLGTDVSCYIEPWANQSKFQFRFEAYVKYQEL